MSHESCMAQLKNLALKQALTCDHPEVRSGYDGLLYCTRCGRRVFLRSAIQIKHDRGEKVTA